MLSRACSAWSAFFVLAACSGSSEDRPTRDRDDDTPGATDDSPSDGDGSDDTEDGGTTTPSSAKKTCEEYIRCLSEADPSTAGGLVSLYGDASACWKGSAADAEACGRACQKGIDDEPACSPVTDERTDYAVECTSAQGPNAFTIRYAATFDRGVRSGSRLTLRPFPKATTRYQPAEALEAQPVLTLDTSLGARSDEAFLVPAAASPTGSPVGVSSLALAPLVPAGNGFTSGFEMHITQPIQTLYSGECTFLALELGDDFPSP